jgi:DHA1 family bicyclomycin/chloramphenicol resistance-like MFS transporter
VVSVVIPARRAGTALAAAAVKGRRGFAGILVPLFCFVACHGFTMPNSTALAMAPHGAVAGSASALLGTLQFSMGATAGALVGVLGNGTAVPFAAVIAACGLGSLLALRLIALPAEQRHA